MIEAAESEDVDAVLELWLALIEHGRRYGLTIQSTPNRIAARQTLSAAVADGRVLVARADSPRDRDLLGFCSITLESGGFRRDRARGTVENLYVRPGARSEGIGTTLLERAEERLRERGAEEISVETMAPDDDARAFYRAHGYEPARVAMRKRVETDR